MSLVHGGVAALVAVAVREAGVATVALDGEEAVVETDALEDSVEPEGAGDVLGFADALPAFDPDVALVHPANAAAATSTRTVSCELRRFIGLPFARDPDPAVLSTKFGASGEPDRRTSSLS